MNVSCYRGGFCLTKQSFVCQNWQIQFHRCNRRFLKRIVQLWLSKQPVRALGKFKKKKKKSLVKKWLWFALKFPPVQHQLEIRRSCSPSANLFFLSSSLPSPANFPDAVVDNLPADISTGIYYGWACVGNGDVYKMVMSIGWNPYYKNTKKSMVSRKAAFIANHLVTYWEINLYNYRWSLTIPCSVNIVTSPLSAGNPISHSEAKNICIENEWKTAHWRSVL